MKDNQLGHVHSGSCGHNQGSSYNKDDKDKMCKHGVKACDCDECCDENDEKCEHGANASDCPSCGGSK